MAASPGDARPNISGAYYADDGGRYYIVEQVDGTVMWAGLHNSGFHLGVEFTNVFRGRIGPDGVTIEGDWVDLPRGMDAGGGTVTLEILPAIDPIQLQQKPGGSFGAKLWTQDLPGSRSPVQLPPQDIVAIEKLVRRYDTSVYENNPPARDFTVAWGTAAQPTGPAAPWDNINYCDFVHGNWKDSSGNDEDGDFDFDLTPDLSHMGADFWTAGWLDVRWDDKSARDFIMGRLAGHRVFHCEAPVFSRQNTDESCAATPIILLPGWYERSGNCVLINGRPIDKITLVPPVPHGPHGPITRGYLQFTVGRSGKQVINLQYGETVRVTGVIADDPGHGDVSPEIHPLYAIDIVQKWGIRRPLPTINLTGVWHGEEDQSTFYIRQVGDAVWWLCLSRDQGRSHASVFRGTAQNDLIEGSFVDVPMSTGGRTDAGNLTLTGTPLATTLTVMSRTEPVGPTTLTKLYDVEATPLGSDPR
jgi:hypothetical protein